MPYYLILIFLLAALRVDVTSGNVNPLFDFDKIGVRQFFLAKILYTFISLVKKGYLL